MKLDPIQRKYVKKWVKTRSVGQIASDLSLTEEAVLDYLKHRWSQDKFAKFHQQYLELSKISQNNQSTSSQAQSSSVGNLGGSTALEMKTQPAEIHRRSSRPRFQFLTWISDHFMHIFGIFVLIAIIYFNTLDNAFVSDDIAAIPANPHIGGIRYVTRSALTFIGDLEYFIIYHIFGTSPTYFRLNNIVFHFFNAVAVYWLVEKLANRRVGLLASILFAVHPIQTEAVTWISGGLVSHSAFFILISLGLFFESLHKTMWNKKYWLAVFLFFIGIYFSEKTMGFPLILCVLLFATKSIKQNWQKTIPFFLISSIWIFTYISMIPARISALNIEYSSATSLGNPLIQIPIAISTYLQMIGLPYNLSFYHTQQLISWQEMAGRILVTLVVAGIAVVSLKKTRWVFFWLAFFFLALSPTLTPFGVSSLVAERYVYLATVGIYAVVGLFLDKFFVKPQVQNLMVVLVVTMVITLMITTYLRNQAWQNQDTLWLATDRTAPNSPQNNNNLGDYYIRTGNLEMAVKHFQKAIALNPGYAHAYHNLGNVYGQLGKLDLALASYLQAVKFNPNQWQSYQQIALIHYLQKDQAKARIYIDQALTINPDDQKLKQQKQVIEDATSD